VQTHVCCTEESNGTTAPASVRRGERERVEGNRPTSFHGDTSVKGVECASKCEGDDGDAPSSTPNPSPAPGLQLGKKPVPPGLDPG
jgi:hypothetical protein